MARFEYKVIPAPGKGKKVKGAKGVETGFAQSVENELNLQAEDSWEFLRSETLPSEERQGLTGSRTVFRTVLVFRRETELDEDDATRAALSVLEEEGETFVSPTAPT